MTLEKTAGLPLHLTVEKLARAANDREARVAMASLVKALDSANEAERREARERLAHSLRGNLLERAGEACAVAPNLVPVRVASLLALIPAMKAPRLNYAIRPFAEPTPDQIDEITAVIHNLEACQTPDMIDTYVASICAKLDAVPGLAVIGYAVLRNTMEELVIADYGNALVTTLTDDWQGIYMTSLLSVIETPAYPDAVLDLLYYNNGCFTETSPAALIGVEDPKRLAGMLEVMRCGLLRMTPRDREDYLDDLRDGIPNKVIGWLTKYLPCLCCVPDETRFRLMAYQKLCDKGFDAAHAEGKSPADWGGVRTILNAKRVVHKLCEHGDADYLQSDWEDLESRVDECPGLAWAMTDYAQNELAGTLLSELTGLLADEGVSLPPHLEMQVRLYLTIDLFRSYSGHIAWDCWGWITEFWMPDDDEDDDGDESEESENSAEGQ